MVILIQRTTDKKYLKSLESDIWVDNIREGFEMSYRECLNTKESLLATYQPEQLKEVYNFHKLKEISREEKKEVLNQIKNQRQ